MVLVGGSEQWEADDEPRVRLISRSHSISDLLVHLWGEVVAGLLGDEVEC